MIKLLAGVNIKKMEMKILQKIMSLTNAEQIKAYSDPYRLKIMSEFYNIKRPATVKEIADIMNEVPSKVHYHVKKLEKAKILELDHTQEINGIIAKFYEPTAESYNISEKKLSDTMDMIMKNETEKLINNLYENSKNIFLESMRKLNSDEDDVSQGNCSLSDVYLTDSEVIKFEEYIMKFIKEHNKFEKDICAQKYHLFTTFIKRE